MPSNDSSPDETCVRCTHLGSAHDTKGCHPDPGRHECNCHAFVPADAETAGEPEAPEPWPCGDCGAMVPAGQDWCRNCGDVKPGPSAPAPYTAGWTDRLDPGCARPDGCTDRLKRHCGSGLDGCAFAAQLRGERLMPREPEAPACSVCGQEAAEKHACDPEFIRVQEALERAKKPASPRPPFLVAYATGSGALNELALPGEASVAVVDGSLVISHASGVLGIAHVRPLEGP